MKSPSQAGILCPGRNCWRIERARRLAMILDAGPYYLHFARAAAAARHALYLAGWDVDSRTRLWFEDGPPDLPETLGPFLDALVRRRSGLHAYVLPWDWAMIYVLEREIAPLYAFGYRTHRRVRCRLDDAHPVGASQHQKLVVVDDRLAFTGGIDIALSRWDTSEHRADDPRRTDPSGARYFPVHDVQVAVDGPCAAALGELFRDRWRRSGGRRLRAPRAEDDPWPAELDADLEDVDVAVARTLPAWDGRHEVREVERLHLDAIAAARETIFIENQYFTAHRIAAALAARLAEPDGPEVVVVNPRECPGWLEQGTMGVLRARVFERLRAADRHGRLAVHHPTVPGIGDSQLFVHSKLMIVDDRIALVGTANLSNRSMGLDSELVLAVEAAESGPVARGIARLRDRLLAHHLGRDAEDVRARIEADGSVRGAIAALRDGPRTLETLDPRAPEWASALVIEGDVVDPERSMSPQDFARALAPEDLQESSRSTLWRAALLLAVVVGLAAVWRWTPLGEWIEPRRLVGMFHEVASPDWMPLAAIGGFVVASFLVVPVTVLVLAAAILFDPLEGWAYALGGATAAATANYFVGRAIGRNAARRFAGRRLRRLSERLRKRGVLSTAVLRLLPVAPFTVINFVAGALRVPAPHFVAGTILGMAPGTALITIFGDRLVRAIRAPDPSNFAWLAGAVALIAVLAFAARRLFGDRRDRPEEDAR